MHPFVAHFVETKKASFEKFCEAALNFGPGVISDIEEHLPSGTAQNYISKIRALRDFISKNGLRSCEQKELLQTLETAGVTGVNHISKRRLSGHYAERRPTADRCEEIKRSLKTLASRELAHIRLHIDGLLSSLALSE